MNWFYTYQCPSDIPDLVWVVPHESFCPHGDSIETWLAYTPPPPPPPPKPEEEKEEEEEEKANDELPDHE
jgi:hypothetical protein